jgi:hypothetical protein
MDGKWLPIGRQAPANVRLTVRIATFLVAAAAGLPQDQGAASRVEGPKHEDPQTAPGPAPRVRRLEAVTWNPVTDELTWVVSAGTKNGNSYQPGPTETYLIQLGSATMKFKNEGRRFSDAEAEYVHMLMDVISRYAVESTVWWEAGGGDRIDKQHPAPAPKKDEEKKTRPPAQSSAIPIARKSGTGPEKLADDSGTLDLGRLLMESALR